MTPETAIKKQIKDYLKATGWFCYHNLAGLGSYPGINDITAIKFGIHLHIEVKTEMGIQSERQKIFEQNIKDAGGYYLIARGYEDVENFIQRILKK